MKIRECTQCPLHETRTKVVVSRGGHRSGVFLVGEAPGKEEDLTGMPFVGRSGKTLSTYLEKYLIGTISEEDLYITNAVKCRPPENRDPTDEELSACAHWLDKQIAKFKPWLIVALGAPAVKRLTGNATLGDRVGEIEWSEKYDCAILITYHPAYIARGNQNGMKAWHRDFEWLNLCINTPQWWWQQVLKDIKIGKRMTVDTINES